MNEILKTIFRIGVVPVIAIDDAKKAVPLAKALVAGGISAAEVTFRTDAAEDAMRAIAQEVPEMLLGAGTVLTREQLDRALDAGAQFIVSPGFNPELVRYGLARGALMLPGTATGGEMEQAMALGLEAVKFFPAEENGGVKKLKALAGPYRKLLWMPTGGVNAQNLADYLSFDQILACGGTWMVKKDMIEGERWDEITALCKEAVRTMLDFRLAHVGVNCGSEEEAHRLASFMGACFGFAPRQTKTAWFAGKAIEYMDNGGPGEKGHIAIGTSSVERAMYHLGRMGVEFLPESVQYDAWGRARFAYLKGDFGGFAVHIVNR